MMFSKSLKFVEAEKVQTDPFQSAKTRLVQNLETQLKCAEAMVKGESYTVPSTKTVTDADGVKKTVTVPHAPRHWYWRDREGNIRFCIRVFNKRMEFEEGKNAIELSSKEELEPTLQDIKKAVNNEEFDKLLEEQLAYGSRLTKVN